MKCPACRRSFTDYPEFALPEKHFTRGVIEPLCRRYLEDPKTSYRKTATEDGMPIFYPEDDAAAFRSGGGYEAPDEDDLVPMLSHTSIYHWLTGLGQQEITAMAAGSKEVTAPARSPSGKYRSYRRQQILRACKRLLVTPRPRR